MTWSIVARDSSGALGAIVASRFFAVGALCPHVHSGVGALCTQALVNPLYGARGLSRLARGMAPMDVVRSLVSADAGREHRQLHLVDAEGNVASHTGAECIEWCGQIAGDGYSVAGNMLAGPQVIEDTAQVYDAGRDLRVDDHPDPLVELQRLYVKSLERFQPFAACLPSRARPAGITDRASIEDEVRRFHAARAQPADR